MNITDYETFVAQIEPDGLACLTALAIKSPQPISELGRIVRLGERKVKEIMQRLHRFGYAGPVAPLDLTKWNITTKAQALLSGFFQNLLGRGSDPRQLSLSNGSNPEQSPRGGSDPASLDLDGVARRAQHALIHSDQIIDQSFEFDHDHDSEMNETAERDVQAVAAALDTYKIRDLPGKPNRTILLADVWVTPERITAAIERAKANPLRQSPSPIGLAVAELLKHRPEIDEWIEQHAQAEQAEPIEVEQRVDHKAIAIAQARAEIKRIEDAMNSATWEDHHSLSIERQSAYAQLHTLIGQG
jgi:hypothetical protein